MEKVKSIAVLITCYNRRRKTLACLESLSKAMDQVCEYTFDIYLVDDDSSDGTAKAVKSQFPLVNVIQGNGNLYWNRGMHKAWETAAKVKNFDFYLWLNDDTVLIPSALKSLINVTLETETKAIIVGSTSSSVQNDKLTYGGFDRNKQLIYPNGNLQPCNSFNGNCVLIPSTVYQKVGNLDYHFRHAIGDIDYGLRALKKGISLFIAPSFIGHCEVHDSYPIWCNKFQKLNLRLKYLYSPLGNNPLEFFIFEFRHYGLMIAIKHFFSIHLRAFIPQLWYKKIREFRK